MTDTTQLGHDALAKIGAQLDQYLAAPDNVVALEAAREQLRHLLDAPQAARLRGTLAFCAELATVLGELSSRPELFSAPHRDVLRQALDGLARHLDALADGADDAALRLFPEYRALQQLRGLETSFELDLFHPDPDVQLPQQVLDTPQEDDAAHRLKALRSQYQQGLLHWLRKHDAPAASQAMRQALDSALRCLPQDASRAFWWVAGGLLECLRQDEMPAEANVGRLLGRIDQQMRAVAAEEQHAVGADHGGGAQPLLDEMLYLIGRSRATGGRADEIRLVYALDCYLPGRYLPGRYLPERYLPGQVALPPGAAEEILAALHGCLQDAEASWEQCAQGNRAACEKFSGHAGQLAAYGERLDRVALRYLSAQIHELSQCADSPEHARHIAPDMAMALLLLGSGIRHYASPGSGFLKQARILAGRIREKCIGAAAQQPEDARQLDELVRLHCLLQRGDARLHLFNEMLANLQHLEHGLSAFCADPAGRGELAGLLHLSGQIQGGLQIASLGQAAQLLASVQGSMRRFAQSNDVAQQAERLALDGAVQALQNYLQRLAGGRAGDVSLLQAASDGMAQLRQAPAQTPTAAPEQPPAAGMPPPASVDQELLEVFLDEAQEVLHAMRNNLEACRLHPGREPLVNIRRGFHTLKGSGRMVGLADLGETAWCVERALNRWLQDNRPASPGLLRFIAAAEQRFSGWVDALNSQGGADIEAGDLVAAAQQIEDGAEAGPTTQKTLPATALGREAAPPVAATDETPHEPAPTRGEPAAAAVVAEKLQARDEIDAQLLPLFLEEASELLPQIGAGLRAWRGDADDARQAQLLKRLHTLKGSARMAGAMRIGGILHEMEARILPAAPALPRAELRDTLESDLDRVAAMLEKLHGGQAGAARDAAGQHAPEYTGAERRGELRSAEDGAEEGGAGYAMLRVRADMMDRLVNEAGEIGMARARVETEMHAFKDGLQELTGSVARLRAQLRELEMQAESRIQARTPLPGDGAEQFDPLEFDRFTRLQELTRFMNESVHDVQAVQRALLKNFDGAATALAAQARLNRALQQNLMNVRMVPFASIGERLYRIVRQTAKELDKRANLELLGAELEVDRSVLEKMTAPFEHLLRNALVHGIENEAARARGGKNPIGEIRLGLRHEGNEVVFEFGDDGAGLDLAALRDKAIAKGLLQPDEAAGDARLAQLVFASGISTATEVTQVAGRGIGMDVVCGEIAALGGRIEVSSQKGLGTRFTIRLPLTLAVTHVLLVRSGDATYAIPSNMVEQVRQVNPAELAQCYRERKIEWRGDSYPFHYLPHLLGGSGRAPENLRHNPLLLLRGGGQRIALHVDGLLGNQEAMLENTGPQLAQLPVVAGATLQGDGTVTLILNPAQLARRAAATMPPQGGIAGPEKTDAGPLVMVVDDSLTVRKITSRLLTRAGYRVATARDGMDALEQLDETLPDALLPDALLLDIEMPRMDGFELTRQLRRAPRTQHLPIIMITSRAADKHRDYAMQLGANAYLGKPYREDELLREIGGFAPAPQAGFSRMEPGIPGEISA